MKLSNECVPGSRELVTFNVDGVEYKLTLATTENILAGEAIRLVSLQDIQTELDINQAQAWQELVSVLTHEIMNSITPVRSLAASASELADEMADKIDADSPAAEDFEDMRDAVKAVEKRSTNLMEFVGSYRQLTRDLRRRRKSASQSPICSRFRGKSSPLPSGRRAKTGSPINTRTRESRRLRGPGTSRTRCYSTCCATPGMRPSRWTIRRSKSPHASIVAAMSLLKSATTDQACPPRSQRRYSYLSSRPRNAALA